jgi:hypothetical protein
MSITVEVETNIYIYMHFINKIIYLNMLNECDDHCESINWKNDRLCKDLYMRTRKGR